MTLGTFTLGQFEAKVYEAEQGFTVTTVQRGDLPRTSLSNHEEMDRAVTEFQRVVVEALEAELLARGIDRLQN